MSRIVTRFPRPIQKYNSVKDFSKIVHSLFPFIEDKSISDLKQLDLGTLTAINALLQVGYRAKEIRFDVYFNPYGEYFNFGLRSRWCGYFFHWCRCLAYEFKFNVPVQHEEWFKHSIETMRKAPVRKIPLYDAQVGDVAIWEWEHYNFGHIGIICKNDIEKEQFVICEGCVCGRKVVKRLYKYDKLSYGKKKFAEIVRYV